MNSSPPVLAVHEFSTAGRMPALPAAAFWALCGARRRSADPGSALRHFVSSWFIRVHLYY